MKNNHLHRRKIFRKIRRKVWIFNITFTIIIIGIIVYLFNFNYPKQTIENFFKQPLVITIPVRYEISPEMGCEIKLFRNMTVTSYSNRIEETDNTPNHTATGRLVYEGSCAVSQDLFRKQIKPGDIIYLVEMDKYLIVEDTMNQRHTNHIDVFLYKRRRKDGTIPKKYLSSFKSDVYVISCVK